MDKNMQLISTLVIMAAGMILANWYYFGKRSPYNKNKDHNEHDGQSQQ